MKYITYHPPAALKNYVRYFWSFDSLQQGAQRLHIKSFADKYPRLIFQNLNGFESLRNLQGNKMPVCYLSGIDTQSTDALMGSTFSHFGVSFYPHALTTFFGIAASALVNTMPDVQLFCKEQIGDKLQWATSHVERVQIMSNFFYDRLMHSKSNDLLVNDLIHSGVITATENLLLCHKGYKISERQLQRRFKTSVGISIKKFQRIVRFESALQLLKSSAYNELTSVAHTLEYTDQSHFIREFVEFSGMTPYAFVKDKSLGSESASFIYKGE